MRQISDDERRTRLGRRHALAEPVASVVAATEAMTCLHATEPASVHLAAFARSGATRAAVDAALYDDRSVVKQLAMRRTVFAFPAGLLPAVWGSAAARTAHLQRGQLARDVVKVGIADDGDAWVAEQTAAVHDLLRADGPRTTMQLRAALPALDARMTYAEGKSYGGEMPIAPRVLTTLAASGVIVRGENEGGWKSSRPRWTAVEDWLPDAPDRLPEREAYAALVLSWLRTFGPGTEDDIVWWLGATKAAVRHALQDVGAVEVGVAGGIGYLAPDDTGADEETAPWAALLPALDPTTMGWKGRDWYLGPHAAAIFDRNGNGGPTAWWCGRIVGGWRQELDGSVVVVPAEPLERAATRALAEQADRLTAWLDGDVVKSIYQSPLVRAGG
ncbi:winged helix DNA-binding domain-containing protein [Nocardioides marmoriginsengisoli]|uniref:Winged helix DNA-binding domain-containing protein n=1 Tax=Nocardioides marmoriginsengisoli TaxID=661483 RepID=A0A3N0CK12_9ACTN|nr:winged helix DNA-binding domain-containing protein [Nocardioides marmoriginsengisoli]RNL63785.1 winged helix DNA-binding domain-containing protein [Nocardioides marmoriginsengisoli]